MTFLARMPGNAAKHDWGYNAKTRQSLPPSRLHLRISARTSRTRLSLLGNTVFPVCLLLVGLTSFAAQAASFRALAAPCMMLAQGQAMPENATKAAIAEKAASKEGNVVLANDYIKLEINDDGRLGVRSTGGRDGGGDDSSDDNKTLVYGSYGSTSGLALNVDGTNYSESNLVGSVTDALHALGSTSATMSWEKAGVKLTATYALAQGSSGNPDVAKVTFLLKNTAEQQKTVGVKFGFDTMIGANDAARIATASGIISVETGFGLGYTLPVPAYWQAFELDNISHPGLVAQGTFSGADLTPPDVFIAGSYSAVSSGSVWDLTASGDPYGDSAVGLWWKNRVLAPGASVTFRTAYGLGQYSAAAGELALTLAAPTIVDRHSANPFDVNVQIQNTSQRTATNIAVSIELSSHLTVQGGTPLTRTIASLAPNALALVSWPVHAELLAEPHSENIRIQAVADGFQQNMLEQAVQLKALPSMSVTPPARTLSAQAGVASFDVAFTGDEAIDWTASVVSNTPWAAIASPATGTGAGTFQVACTANPGSAPRVATIRVTATGTGVANNPSEVTVEQDAGGAEGEGEGELDSDGDGLSNADELAIYHTDPDEPDTDNDAMPDGWEVQNDLAPRDPADADRDDDNDGLSNVQEYLGRSNPHDPASPVPIHFVDDTAGSDETGDGTAANPWKTIPFAIAQLPEILLVPHTLRLAPGTYDGIGTLKPNVTIAGAGAANTLILGTIEGMTGVELRDIELRQPLEKADVALLHIENVNMTLQDVVFNGEDAGVGAIVDTDNGVGTLFDRCTFTHLATGIIVSNALPTIRRCVFEEVSGDAIVLEGLDTTKGANSGTLGEAGNSNSGFNTFALTIHGLALNNERPDPIVMQNNDWGTNDDALIASRVSANTTFIPRLQQGQGLLSAAAACSVWDAETQANVTNASVQVTPGAYAPVTANQNGVYSLACLPSGVYTFTVTAPGYVSSTKQATLEAGTLAASLFPLTPVTGEGEGEGEDDFWDCTGGSTGVAAVAWTFALFAWVSDLVIVLVRLWLG